MERTQCSMQLSQTISGRSTKLIMTRSRRPWRTWRSARPGLARQHGGTCGKSSRLRIMSIRFYFILFLVCCNPCETCAACILGRSLSTQPIHAPCWTTLFPELSKASKTYMVAYLCIPTSRRCEEGNAPSHEPMSIA